MATMIESVQGTSTGEMSASRQRLQTAGGRTPVALPWLRAQSINVGRHAAALRPFKGDEFGNGAEAPTAGHIQAVNKLITGLRSGLLKMSGKVARSARDAREEQGKAQLQDLMRKKEHAHVWVRGIEKIWDFYF